MRRWLLPLVGLVAVLLIVGALVVIVLNMQSTAATAETREAYGYLPDDAAMALEMRLDLPGDQREQFITFLSRFPGFDDPAQVERRMEELLNEAIATGTQGMANYQDDVEPWFTGWLVVGGQAPAGIADPESGSAVVVLGSTDRARAELGMERLRGAGSWSSSAGPGGATVWTNAGDVDGAMSAYALTDDAVVVAAGAADVRGALEIKAGNAPSLLEVGRFTDALGRQPEGRLAMFWMDVESFTDSLGSIGGGGDNPLQECAGFPAPEAATGSLYMRDGRAIMDFALQLPADAEMPEMRDSGLAQRMPADTFMFVDVHDVGSSTTELVGCLRDAPMVGQQLRDLEEQLGQPLDSLVGWAGDAAIGVRYDGSRLAGGLVVRVTDEQRAAEAMGQLRLLITSMGGEEGDVTVREEEYNGARMTIFEFDELGEMGEPPAPLPSLAYAFHGDLLVLGVDAGFARAVVDTQAGDSLNAQPAFRRSVDAAGGASNGGVFYLNVGTAMDLAEGVILPAVAGAPLDGQFEEVRAIIRSLESITAVSSSDGQAMVTRLVVSTREPTP